MVKEAVSLSAVGIVGMDVGEYTIQFRATTGQRSWITCLKPGPGYTFGHDVAAVFDNITEAEAWMNKLRDDNPQTVYRMTQKMTIVQVVYS